MCVCLMHSALLLQLETNRVFALGAWTATGASASAFVKGFAGYRFVLLATATLVAIVVVVVVLELRMRSRPTVCVCVCVCI